MDLEVHIIIEIFGAGLLQVRHLWRKSPGLVFTTRRVGKNSPGLVGGVRPSGAGAAAPSSWPVNVWLWEWSGVMQPFSRCFTRAIYT